MQFSSAIKYAKAAGLKEACSEFNKVISMSAEKGTRYVNTNYEHLGSTPPASILQWLISSAEWLRLNAEKMYEATQAVGESPELFSTPNNSRPPENRPHQRMKVVFTIP